MDFFFDAHNFETNQNIHHTCFLLVLFFYQSYNNEWLYAQAVVPPPPRQPAYCQRSPSLGALFGRGEDIWHRDRFQRHLAAGWGGEEKHRGGVLQRYDRMPLRVVGHDLILLMNYSMPRRVEGTDLILLMNYRMPRRVEGHDLILLMSVNNYEKSSSFLKYIFADAWTLKLAWKVHCDTKHY